MTKLNLLRFPGRSGLGVVALGLPVVMFVFITNMSPNFLNVQNLSNANAQIAALLIVAVSHTLTSGALPYFEPVLIAICILLVLAVGATNALFITRLRASSVTVTLAVAMILTGVVIWLGQFYAPGDAPDVLKFIGQKRIGIFPIALFVWLAVLIPAALFFRFPVFARYVDAIGANPNATWASAAWTSG